MPRSLNLPQAILAIALHAAGRPLLTQELAVLAGKPQEAIASLLEPLLGAGFVAHTEAPDAWVCPGPAGCRAGRIRAPSRPERPPGSLTHALARLGAPDMALDDCTAIAEAIGDDLGKQRPGSIICMECALRFLIAWGERHLYTAGGSESCLYGQTRPDLSEHVHPCQPPHSSGFQALVHRLRAGGLRRQRTLPPPHRHPQKLYAAALLGAPRRALEHQRNRDRIPAPEGRLRTGDEKPHRLLRRACSMPSAATIRIRCAAMSIRGNPATGSTGSRCSMP